MVALCLALFLNTSGQRNSINVRDVSAVEDRVTYTRIYMSRNGLSLDTKDSFTNVVEKLKEAESACKL